MQCSETAECVKGDPLEILISACRSVHKRENCKICFKFIIEDIFTLTLTIAGFLPLYSTSCYVKAFRILDNAVKRI